MFLDSRAEMHESLPSLQDFFFNDSDRCEECVATTDSVLEFGVETAQGDGCPFEYAQLGYHTGHQRLNQRAVSDSISERGLPGKFLIHMKRIEITRETSEENDVGLRHGPARRVELLARIEVIPEEPSVVFLCTHNSLSRRE